MFYRPLEAWLFRVEGDAPVLLGSCCAVCEQKFFPRRRLCPICLQETAEVELEGEGTLFSHTYVHFPYLGQRKLDAAGYGVGEVDLRDGPRVQTVLAGEPSSWEIGITMRIDLDVVEESDGEEVVMFCFRPAKEPARA